MTERENLPVIIAAQDLTAATRKRGSLILRGLLAIQNGQELERELAELCMAEGALEQAISMANRKDEVLNKIIKTPDMPDQVFEEIRKIVGDSFERGYLFITEINNKFSRYTAVPLLFKKIVAAFRQTQIDFGLQETSDFTPKDLWNFFRVKTEAIGLPEDLEKILSDAGVDLVMLLAAMTRTRLQSVGIDAEGVDLVESSLKNVGIRLAQNENEFDRMLLLHKRYCEIAERAKQ